MVSVRGNPDDPLSRGHICPKGVALADVYEDPDRLRRPVKRVRGADGAEWVEISWDEALDLTADGIATAVNEHGRDALGVYLGNPNAHSLGAQTHGVTDAQDLRTRNKFSATSVDQLPHQFVAWALFGHQLLIPVADIDRTSYFLVFGANPMASNGSLMTVPDFPNRLRELKKRGGRMVVFDPRRTETAKVADEHHFVRPGTDAVVLLAMLHVLFEEDLTDPPSYVRGIGVGPARGRRLHPRARRAALRGPGGGDPADDPRVRGRGRRRGVRPDRPVHAGVRHDLPVGDPVPERPQRQLRPRGRFHVHEPAADIVGNAIGDRGHHDVWRSRVRGLPEFGGELPVATLAEEIETPGEGQIRGLITVRRQPGALDAERGAASTAP